MWHRYLVALIFFAVWDFKHIGIPTFIEGFSDAPVASLEEIVRFNEQNQSLTMPERMKSVLSPFVAGF